METWNFADFHADTVPYLKRLHAVGSLLLLAKQDFSATVLAAIRPSGDGKFVRCILMYEDLYEAIGAGEIERQLQISREHNDKQRSLTR